MLPRYQNTQSPQPERTVAYRGRFTNTDRWDSFVARPDDIFICTPPKCGTTWTQAICAFLILETNELPAKLVDISPWIDGELDPLDACLEKLANQKHRRFIKSHTPLDGIPFFDRRVYLVVYRHPVDAYFSWRNQGLNMKRQPDIPQLDPDPRKGFRAWVDEPHSVDAADSRSLEALVYHYYSFDAYRHLSQIHFIHFANMKRDLPNTLKNIAEILDITVSETRISEICELVSFSSMKRKAGVFSPAAGKSVLKSDDAFFRRGANDQGRTVLTDSDLQRYQEKIETLLSLEEVNWLQSGGELPRAHEPAATLTKWPG